MLVKSMIRFKKMVRPSRVKINPHWHRQHPVKGVARLENKLNCTWTPRNLGHVNNKERKSR